MKEIFERSFFCIKTVVNFIRFFYLFYYSISLKSCIVSDLFYWILNSIFYNFNSNLLICILKLYGIKHFRKLKKHATTSSNDSFFNRSSSCIEGIFDFIFLIFHLHLSCSSHLDHCYSTNEFCQSLSELFSIIIWSRMSKLSLDLVCPCINFIRISFSIYNHSCIFSWNNFISFS